MSSECELSQEQLVAMRDGAIEQVKFARSYLLGLLEAVPDTDWFRIPDGSVSHIAWQVGHLTVAQYGLMLFRQRGRTENDSEIMPGTFRKRFGKGTEPASITPNVISKQDILQQASLVFTESLTFAPTITAETLAEPIDMPYAGYANKLGALLFCPMHEMIHAGQIGLLRRGLGLTPVR